MKHVQEFLRNYEPQKTLYQSLHDIHDDPVKSQVEEALRDGLDADTFKYVKSVFEVFGSFDPPVEYNKALYLDCVDSGRHAKEVDDDGFCLDCGHQ